MRKLITILFSVFFYVVGVAQTLPNYQSFGSPTTLTEFKGVSRAAVGNILTRYADTTTANANAYIKNYAGSQIVIGDTIWFRNSTATEWLKATGAAGGGGGSGTVTSFSIVTANGFSGSVANATTTPALTITTTITGLLKGNGTAISAAVAGTDYLTPTGSAAALTSFPTLNQNTTGSAATLTTGRAISISGDLTYTSPTFDGSGNITAAGTLATVNSNVGTFGSATQSVQFTVNGKGLVTAAANVTITPAVGSITGLGTGVGTALAINVGSAGAFVTFNGAGGTPLSMTGTNISGTASGLSIGGNAATATILATGRTIAITGDLVWTSPSFDGSGNVTAAGTLATVNSNVGSFGSSTSIPTFTVNAKGLITAASGNSITIPVLYTTITYSQLQTAIAASTLNPGETYKITDKGDRGLFFKAIAINEIAKTGQRLMLCPAYYGIGVSGGNTWIGVWNATKNPNIGDLTIWGGLVWESLTGNIGTADSDILLDAVNWVVVPKASFSNGEYTELQFGVRYDVTNDWVEKQWDGSGNVFGIDFHTETTDPIGFNMCDASDWNYASSGLRFYNNKAYGVYNNSCQHIISNIVFRTIKNNSNTSNIIDNWIGSDIANNNSNVTIIQDNFMGGGISSNSNTGNISFNKAHNIGANSNSGNIERNIIPGNIEDNTNIGYVSYNMGNQNIESNSGSINVSDFSFIGNANNTSILLNDNAQTISFSASNGITFTGGVRLNALAGNGAGVVAVDNDGDLSWSAAGGSGATTALDNLAAVAINTSLLPAIDDAIDLGDDTHRWRDIFLGPGSIHVGTSTSDEGVISYNTTTNVLSLTSTGVVSFPTPFTLGATSVTSTGTQLNYLNAATGTTGTTSSNLVFSATSTFTGTTTASIIAASGFSTFTAGFSTGAVAGNSNLYVSGGITANRNTTASLLPLSAAGIGFRASINGTTAYTMTASDANGSLVIGTTGGVTEAASGTHPIVASLIVRPITVTNGAGATDILAGVYIEGPATGVTPATASYGLWVDNGATRLDGDIILDRTITGAGTTGAQTINKISGTVNFATAATTLVVTNSFVTVNSIVYCTVRTADATAVIKSVVAAAGSFTITLNAAATGETSVGFLVTN